MMCRHGYVEKKIIYHTNSLGITTKHIIYQCVFCLHEFKETSVFMAKNRGNDKGNKALLKQKKKYGGEPL